MAVPKRINAIWIQGWDKLPAEYIQNVKETIAKNPDWQFVGWDDNSIRSLLQSMGQQYLDKYNSFKILHQKIDYARYAIMYAGGAGISIDADAKAVKSFNDIPFIGNRNFIVGYSPLDKIGNIAQGNKRRAINNSVIISSPYHPILKEVLDHINTLECKEGQSDFSCIIFTTGQSFNEILYKHRDEIEILDSSFFEGCHVNDESCEWKPNAIIQHEHAQTWVPESHQMLAKFYYWIKAHKALTLAIILGVILLFTSSGKVAIKN